MSGSRRTWRRGGKPGGRAFGLLCGAVAVDLAVLGYFKYAGFLVANVDALFGAGMRDGNAHNPHNLPVVLAGRGGGTLSPGRHLVYEKNTPLCNLYVSMLNRLGTPMEKFSDSTGELPGLSDPSFTGLKPA